MRRIEQITRIKDTDTLFDVAVIGGGATGLGIAVDAASRGFSVVLLEKYDFAKGTSGRSTKLVHGGVRYLAQGNVRLVLEALRERGIMRRNAPHLVHDLTFVVPVYRWWMVPFYYVGLKLYDLLSGRLSLGKSTYIRPSAVMEYLPTVRRQGLRGGIVYHDGQFDDSRMAVSLAKTAEQFGAVVLNHAEVTELRPGRENDASFHLEVRDHFGGETLAVSARTVFNAAGVFADEVQRMENEWSRPLISPSQGTHIVLDREFMPGSHGLMIPKTSDGRVLFAVPWHGKVLVGTTDQPVKQAEDEPRATEEEIDFILETARQYLSKKPVREDIRSVFAGLRPLAAPQEGGTKTKEISRGHQVLISENKLITIIGGKWTTYRDMAEDALRKASEAGLLDDRPCRTAEIPIWESQLEKTKLMDRLIPDAAGNYPISEEDIRYAIREEYSLCVEDVLSRRIRLLITDAAAAVKMAEKVGDILEAELGSEYYDKEADVNAFRSLAENYMVKL